MAIEGSSSPNGPDGDRRGVVIPYRSAPLDRGASRQLAQDGVDDQEDSLTMREALGIFMRQKWMMLGVFVLVMSIAAAYLLTREPVYRAVTTLEFQREELEIIEGTDLQKTTADAEFMATQFALLESRTLATRIAEVTDLVSDGAVVNPEASREERLNQATNHVLANVDVSTVGRSRVIAVGFRDADPNRAAVISNALAENFIQLTLERRFNTSNYAREFLEERLQTTKTALENAERRLVEYSTNEEIVDLSSAGGSEIGSSLDASALIALNASLTEAQDSRMAAEQRLQQARDGGGDTLDTEAIRALRTSRAQLETQRTQMATRFRDDYPEMQEIINQINNVDAQIAAEIARAVQGLEGEVRAARAREEALQLRVNELKGNVQDLRTRSIDYNIIAREVDTLRSQYEALLDRFKDVSISSGVGTNQVAIVDRAQVPRMPSEPNLPLGFGVSLALAFALALGLGLARDFLDDTIKTPQDVKDKLNLPVLGVVPKLRSGEVFLEQLREPRSPIAEAFAALRTALQFSTSQGVPRTVLMTGVRPSEGKTSCVVGLSSVMASSGQQVLVIDADMRRPSFAFDSGRSVGLSGVLAGQGNLADNVVSGDTPHLFLLPAGTIPPNPAELIQSPVMGQIISEASDRVDMVVVDSPPVLDFADAPAISSSTEGTILVLQAGAVRRPLAQRTIERLVGANANILGVILTKFDVNQAGYDYAASYSYKYSYGYGPDTDRRSVRDDVNARRKVQVFAPSKPGKDGDGHREDRSSDGES